MRKLVKERLHVEGQTNGAQIPADASTPAAIRADREQPLQIPHNLYPGVLANSPVLQHVPVSVQAQRIPLVHAGGATHGGNGPL